MTIRNGLLTAGRLAVRSGSGDRPLRGRLLSLAFMGTAIFSIVTIGFPPTLILVGAWLFASIVQRWFHDLKGPTSWAAGILIEGLVVVGESATAALVDPHPHPQWFYVVILILPLVFGALVYGGLRKSDGLRSRRADSPVSSEPWLALFVTLATEAVFELTKIRGDSFGLSWAMAGDARNHVIINRIILNDGGLTFHVLKNAPATINAITATLAGASGRANVSAGTLLIRDVQAMTSVWILSCIAVSCLFIAGIAETLPRVAGRVERISLRFYPVLIGCATLGVGSYVLGLTESGGFLSAIGGLAFALASAIIGLRLIRHFNWLSMSLLAFSTVLVTTSWTVLGVIPAAFVVVGVSCQVFRLIRTTDHDLVRTRIWDWLSMALALFVLLAISSELYLGRATLMITLKGYGGILPPNPGVTAWLGLLCVVVVLIAPNKQQRWLRLSMLGIYVVGVGAALWLRHIEPHGVSWSYYSTKMLWLATASTLWIPFIIATDVVQWCSRLRQLRQARLLIGIPVSLAVTLIFVWFTTIETPFPAPYTFAFTGGGYPTAPMVSLVIKEAKLGGPFVIWSYTKSQGTVSADQFNDQIGNFWSALTWDIQTDGNPMPWRGHVRIPDFFEWAYVEFPQIPSLCQVLHHQSIRIVTSDPNLRHELDKSCKAYVAKSKGDEIQVLPATSPSV